MSFSNRVDNSPDGMDHPLRLVDAMARIRHQQTPACREPFRPIVMQFFPLEAELPNPRQRQ